jgi:hypothetical protein
MKKTVRFILDADIGEKEGFGGYITLTNKVYTEKEVEDIIEELKPLFDTKITNTTKILKTDLSGCEGMIFKGVRVQEVKEFKSYYKGETF